MNELTLEQAKKILRESIEKDGATCPCCNQFVKAYKRKITSSMAYSLIRIVKHLKYESDVEFHLQDLAIELGLNGRDISEFAKLRF
ncbi:MAG: hypothetical protein KC589_02420, partial [Nanoarchaeota archaeon]|nr:hypothetical protein [Nanoarchaeota archaeon]